MRTYLFSVILIFGFSYAIANDFVPIQNGNNWNYETDYDQSAMRSQIQSRDGNWRKFSCFFGLEDQWVWTSDTSTSIYLWNGNDYELLVDTAQAVGTRYNMTVIPGADYAEITDKSMATTVAGDFQTITLAFRSSGRGPVIRGVTFASGVGVLSWDYLNMVDGLSTWSLQDARVAGQTFDFTGTVNPPAPLNACSVTGTFEKNFDYTPLCPMGQPGCTLDPVEVGVSMTITNDGSEDLVYNFTSSKYYEIEILDDTGSVLHRWSDGKFFTQALWDHTIPPGESWTFGDTIQFMTVDGTMLIGGDYILRISMNGLSVTAPFKLQQLMN